MMDVRTCAADDEVNIWISSEVSRVGVSPHGGVQVVMGFCFFGCFQVGVEESDDVVVGFAKRREEVGQVAFGSPGGGGGGRRPIKATQMGVIAGERR